MSFLAATGITAGTRLVSSLFGSIFGGGEPAEPAWGAMRTKFEHELRKSLRGTVEEGGGRLQLEAARSGVSAAGAYLGGLTEIQNRANDILSRELTAYDLQQEAQRTQWQMGKSMAMYQQGQQRRGELLQTIEGIGGDIAGYFTGKGMRERADVIRGEMKEQMSGVEGLMQNQNQLLREEIDTLKQALFGNRVSNAVRPYTTASTPPKLNFEPYITPMQYR